MKYKITMKYTNININDNHIIPQELDNYLNNCNVKLSTYYITYKIVDQNNLNIVFPTG